MDHMHPMYKPNEPLMNVHYSNPPMYVHAANVPAPAPVYGVGVSAAAILVLFILLVIVSRAFGAGF